MKYDKQVIAQIAGVENWEEFEEFVKKLYAKNEHSIHVEKNYKAKGVSGRNREVDVRVTFGFNPHIITLGIECKYWSNKVDGDIIDVAAAKKEDLKLDKYAVITTAGYEAGAEIYAKSKGIDLFIIRPTVDDDFGYSGRVIKTKLHMLGSRPTDININATSVSAQGFEEETSAFVNAKLSNIEVSYCETVSDPDLELYRYSKQDLTNGMVIYNRLAHVENLLSLILRNWQTHNTNIWNNQPYSFNHKILFREPTALFLAGRIPVTINEITFKIQYFRIESEFEVDRGKQHPLILENVIERAVTPLSASYTDTLVEFTMCKSMPKQEVDLATKPDGALGRDGLAITLLCNNPLSVSEDDPHASAYELIDDGNDVNWMPIR